MCPTALGRKEKKLYNVHIVHWHADEQVLSWKTRIGTTATLIARAGECRENAGGLHGNNQLGGDGGAANSSLLK